MRRVLLALLAAILLALSPSAAFAYEGDDEVMGVSDSNPEAGEAFTVTIQADTCPTVRLDVDAPSGVVTIDGEETNSATKPAVDGEASFEVVIDEEGEYRLTGYCDATDEVLGVQMVTVGGAEAGGGTAGDEQQAGLLPDTGAGSTTTVLAVGGLVLLAGGVLLMARRRKGDVG